MDYHLFENLLKMHKTTVYRVAKATGISSSTFTDWKNGRSAPKADKLVLIADYFNVSLDTLLGAGHGQRAKGVDTVALLAEKMVPIVSEIRAGRPIITDECRVGSELADVEDSDDYFYLEISDNAMKNCGMIKGSDVLFHKQQSAEDSDIVAVLSGGELAAVRRYKRVRRKVILSAENPEFSPIELSSDDFEAGKARILGVAQEIKIKLK